MAYALFKDEERLSRTFPAQEEALEKADRAGLVEHDDGQPVLEDDFKIKSCSADPEPQDESALDWTPDKPAS